MEASACVVVSIWISVALCGCAGGVTHSGGHSPDVSGHPDASLTEDSSVLRFVPDRGGDGGASSLADGEGAADGGSDVRARVCPDGGQPCDPGTKVSCSTGALGVCGVGYQLCQEDGCGYGECLTDTTAQQEVGCDGLDNDCDGDVDELDTPEDLRLVVRARGTPYDDGADNDPSNDWPLMEVWLRSKADLRWTKYTDHLVGTPEWVEYEYRVVDGLAYDRLALRFVNDQAGPDQDRNLFIDSVRTWDNRFITAEQGLYYNRGSSSDASLEDLANIIPPVSGMAWNGALHFNLACEPPTPRRYDVALSMAVDDVYDLWVDGQLRAQGVTDYATAETYGPAELGQLSSGRHVIAVHARGSRVDPDNGMVGMLAKLEVGGQLAFLTGGHGLPDVGSFWYVAPPGDDPADSHWMQLDFARSGWIPNVSCVFAEGDPRTAFIPAAVGQARFVWNDASCAVVEQDAYFRLDFVLP